MHACHLARSDSLCLSVSPPRFGSPIPHSIYDPTNNPGSELCLFTKDPPAQSADEVPSSVSGIPIENPIKNQLAAKPVTGVTKVLAISKLRKNYHEFKDRRRLLSSYSLFLCDERIMPLLPPLLGSKFYEKKKQPVPVNLNMADFSKELIKARDSTYMFINTGASLTVRIARSSFSRAETLANIQAALPVIAANIPKKWAGIQSIHIKSQDSIALPIYNHGAALEPLLADPEPTAEEKKQKAKSDKKKNAAAASKKKGTKRALSTKKEDKKPAPSSSAKKQKPAAAAPAPVAAAKPVAAAAPASAKKVSGKRQRDEEPLAPTSPAPAAKKTKQAVEAVTPAKKAAPAPTAKSAVKAAATPAKAASTKKAPATVASKKK